MAARHLLSISLLAVVIGIVLRYFIPSRCNSSDTGWFSSVAHGNHSSSYRLQSFYVVTRDGTRLAVDVYLPSWWKEESAGLPTILHFTRYNRAFRVRWAWRWLLGRQLNTRSMKWVDAFIPRGYALVTVDVRGTGASFGERPVDMQPREISDLPDVLDWVLNQMWCNGRVGTGGISYDGMLGLLLAAQADGHVQAVAHQFSPDDVFEDIAAPGGVACTGFARDYVSLTTSMERNEPVSVCLPWRVWFYVSFVINGSAPVTGHEAEHRNTIEMHRRNWNGTEFLQKLQFKDDVIKEVDGQHYSAMSIDIDSDVAQKLIDNDVAVYHFGGYFDSGTARSAVNMHRRLEIGGKSKLTIGPWTHGGRRNSSPFSPSDNVCFDFQSDIVRFFDFYLKDEETGVDKEMPVHYFTMGEERWKAAERWPHSDVTYRSLYLSDGFRLSETNEATDSVDKYVVDYSATSGVVSRWNLVYHLFMQSVVYSNRVEQSTHTLSYMSECYTQPQTVTGIVTIRLHIESVKSRDLILFAYLEDVDCESSKVTYVTEGSLRASHRCTNESDAGHCKRSYRKSDWKPMDGVERVEMYLEPVSYQFPAGHRVRFSLAGADRDNFDHDTRRFGFSLPEQWHVYRGGHFDSQVILPLE